MAQLVKNPPAMQETWVWSLGWEDPLEKGMATHSSILAWRIPWTEEPGGLQSMGFQRVRHDPAWRTHRGPESPTEESQQWLLSISPQGRTRHREHGSGPRSGGRRPSPPPALSSRHSGSGLCSQRARRGPCSPACRFSSWTLGRLGLRDASSTLLLLSPGLFLASPSSKGLSLPYRMLPVYSVSLVKTKEMN